MVADISSGTGKDWDKLTEQGGEPVRLAGKAAK
jgi:hypothetical protein